MKDIEIFACTHKEYGFPNDTGYTPLQVGKAGSGQWLPYLGDNTGENISDQNPYFCELTGIYWAWKNTDSKIVGFSHYRRYFGKKRFFEDGISHLGNHVYSSRTLLRLMSNMDVLVPNDRWYGIDTVRSHYRHSHYENDLLLMKNIISDMFPEYLDAVDEIFNQRKLALYNMFVMKRPIFDTYCSWLFPILFELEKKIGYQEYGPYQKRVLGFLSERLFNIWLHANKDIIRAKRLPVVNLEGEPLVGKALQYISRKILRQKPL